MFASPRPATDAMSRLLQRRLLSQRLIGTPLASAADVVRHLGAVQAQDYPMAKWGIAQRMAGATDAALDADIDSGAVLRTHVLRPTWHFVLPEDIRWLLDLTGPRVRRAMASYRGRLEITPELLSASRDAVIEGLRGCCFKTRRELGAVLAGAGVVATGQRLAHIIMEFELDALICSGPRRGKQFTYALLDERAPAEGSRPRDQALADLARRYFSGHGPAQVRDFAWWAGLTAADSRAALGSIAGEFERLDIDGKEYWCAPDSPQPRPDPPRAHLLSIYDEYTIAYNDRSALAADDSDADRLRLMSAALTAVAALDGRLVGTWRRVSLRKAIEVRLTPFRPLDPPSIEALEAAVAAYGAFLEVPATLVVEEA
jgi:hypothetical protein